jgi:hypothetical protein
MYLHLWGSKESGLQKLNYFQLHVAGVEKQSATKIGGSGISYLKI